MCKTHGLKSQVELVVFSLDLLETQSMRQIPWREEVNNENVLQKMLLVLSNHVKMSDIKSTAIEAYHRLSVQKYRFTSWWVLFCVWSAKTKLKGTKITMMEFLTKFCQEVFTEHFGIKKCLSAWVLIVILLPNKSKIKICSI